MSPAVIFVSAVGGDKILAGDRDMLLVRRSNLTAAAQFTRPVISIHPPLSPENRANVVSWFVQRKARVAVLIGGQVREIKQGQESAVRTADGKTPRLSHLLPSHEADWLEAMTEYIRAFDEGLVDT